MIPDYILAMGGVIFLIILYVIYKGLKTDWELCALPVYSKAKYAGAQVLALIGGTVIGALIGAILMWAYLNGLIDKSW